MVNMLWGWGRRNAEAKKLRELQHARDTVCDAWDQAHRNYRNAVDRGDTRSINTTYQALREAFNERLKAGC